MSRRKSGGFSGFRRLASNWTNQVADSYLRQLRVEALEERQLLSVSPYRWQAFNTYDQASGWMMGNNPAMYGGVAPSVWTDGNGTAGQMSTDLQVLSTLFTNKGYADKNAMIWSEESSLYSSTNGRIAAALFRVQNTTGSPITWTPNFYYSSYASWGETASVALNGTNVWTAPGNGLGQTSTNVVIPANSTNTVIFTSTTSPPSVQMRGSQLAFYNNSLLLPSGLTFVDDLPAGPLPSLALSPATVTHAEGDAGTTPYVFTVTLSVVSGQTVTVAYGTANGTATTADNDYQATSGVLTFAPGQTVKQVTVLVNGDTSNEADEDFTIAISSPTNATLGASSATGTIQNDDQLPSTIAGRHLFYNQSGTSTRYDGNNLAINASDDAAIASDKTAYLWEDAVAATFANVSSYTKGINGIMVDISGSHPSITADDFIFRVGNNNSPGTWGTANAPTSISVRAGAGVGGSDRVTIIWNGAAAPIKQWLNVIVLANADTGLAQKVGYPVGHGDQFFFGNAVGNVGLGDTSANSLVSAVDENAIRANPAFISANIPITNIYDVGRNASVSALDESAARLNGTNPSTTLKYLNLTSAPAAPEAGGGSVSPLVSGDSVSGDSGVASALTSTATTGGEISVPKWISNRIDSIDLNSGAPARLFHYLLDANTPGSRARLQKFDAVADSLGLDDTLLEELLADLGL